MKTSRHTDEKAEKLEDYSEEWEKILVKLDKLDSFANDKRVLSELKASLSHPFSLAVLGRIKTGKSTLINALIGRNLSLIGIKETTALINRICIGKKSGCYTVFWEDRQPDVDLHIDTLGSWNNEHFKATPDPKKTPKFLELYADTGEYVNFHIIDTPGTGSIFTDRDEVSKNFIRGHGANAMIYVLSHAGRDSDKRNLADYREYMEEFGITSENYCIAVLQKWDEVYWNSGLREDINVVRDDIAMALGSAVCGVIPVIAPLGLLAHEKNQSYERMPETFWLPCLKILKQYDNVNALCDDLLYSDKWDASEERAELRQTAEKKGVPWNCFRLALRELKKKGIEVIGDGPEAEAAAVEKARQYIWNISGIGELKEVIDKRFSSNAEQLRLMQIYERAERVTKKIRETLELRVRKLNNVLESLAVLQRESQGKSRTEQYILSAKILENYKTDIEKEKRECEDVLKTLHHITDHIGSENFRRTLNLKMKNQMMDTGSFRAALFDVGRLSGYDDNSISELYQACLRFQEKNPLSHREERARLRPLLMPLLTAPDAQVRQTASYLIHHITPALTQ